MLGHLSLVGQTLTRIRRRRLDSATETLARKVSGPLRWKQVGRQAARAVRVRDQVQEAESCQDNSAHRLRAHCHLPAAQDQLHLRGKFGAAGPARLGLEGAQFCAARLGAPLETPLGRAGPSFGSIHLKRSIPALAASAQLISAPAALKVDSSAWLSSARPRVVSRSLARRHLSAGAGS